MKIGVLVAALGMTASLAAAQTRGQRQTAAASPDRVAEAYNQFLLGHRLEESDDDSGAIAAYKRARELDPLAADIPAEFVLAVRRNECGEEPARVQRGIAEVFICRAVELVRAGLQLVVVKSLALVLGLLPVDLDLELLDRLD